MTRPCARPWLRTDWTKLRVEPLLEHVKRLDQILTSPKFARETVRLRKGVAMFHADLVYLRTNMKAMIADERAANRVRPQLS